MRTSLLVVTCHHCGDRGIAGEDHTCPMRAAIVALLATLTIIAVPAAADARDSGWNGTRTCSHCK